MNSEGSRVESESPREREFVVSLIAAGEAEVDSEVEQRRYRSLVVEYS